MRRDRRRAWAATADLQPSLYPEVRSDILAERRSWVLLPTETEKISGAGVRRAVHRMQVGGTIERESVDGGLESMDASPRSKSRRSP